MGRLRCWRATLGYFPARSATLRRLGSFRHGEGVKTVQRRLGHSSAAIALDIYTHLWSDSDDRTRKVVELALSAPADTVRAEERSS